MSVEAWEGSDVWASGARTGWIGIREVGESELEISCTRKDGFAVSVNMTPAQAAVLARKLWRHAKRRGYQPPEGESK